MRLIDADALSKDLEKRWDVNDDQDFCNKEVWHALEEAPTIEPDGDTISRSRAIKDVSEWATDILHPDRLVKEDAIHILESLPSAEQVTGKLKNPCDSLLTDDSKACKEQKSKLDLISRQDALAEFRDGRDVYDIMESIEELPSAEVEDRLYIKIYADDEPSVMAEKLYQICDETQNGEVAEWLEEYFPSAEPKPNGDLISRQDAIAYFFRPYSNEELYSNTDIEKILNALPSAPDSRQRGEWVAKSERNRWMRKCSACGWMQEIDTPKMQGWVYRYCPNCGVRMYKGGEDE